MSQKGQIKTTNKVILESSAILFNIANIDSWPVRIKYELSALVIEFRKYFAPASEVRDSLIRKYATINPKTSKPIVNKDGNITVDPDKSDEYNADLAELGKQEITMEAFKVIIPSKDLPKEVTAFQMAIVKDFIVLKLD
jgi:hypothetical protein